MDVIKEGMLASAKAAEAAARIGERLFCQNTPNVMNFNSQICTSRKQSERLLALGLKPETADFYTPIKLNPDKGSLPCHPDFWISDEPFIKKIREASIPAWSLGRLIKDLMPQSIGRLELAVGNDYAGYYEDRFNSETGMYWEHTEESSNLYDNIISTIEWLIKEGYFNKKYLV